MVRARLSGFGFRARTSGREFQGWRPGGRHGSRSSPRFRFSGANLGPGIPGLEARRPAWFALVSPVSVFGREPRAGNFGIGGPPAGMVRARLPGFGFRARTSGREFQGWRPGGRHGSRSSPRFRFPGAVCSPLLASPCSSVSGSKFFTHFPRRRRGPAAFFRVRFAPRSSLALAGEIDVLCWMKEGVTLLPEEGDVVSIKIARKYDDNKFITGTITHVNTKRYF